MTKIIAVINQKGGVGKTATACNLSYCLVKKELRALLIDLDPSANASRIFVPDTSAGITIKNFLGLPDDCRALEIPKAEQNGIQIPSFWIIPSNIGLAMAEREFGNKPFRETLLDRKLKKASFFKGLDFIILDCPPTLTTLTINAMFTADLILVPITYAKDALEGVGDLFDLLGEIKEGHNYQIKLVRNQFDARKKTANNYMSMSLEGFVDENLVLQTIIRQDEEVNKASIAGQTVMIAAPNSNAAQDYKSLCDEIMKLGD